MKRILIVITTLGFGGAETQVSRLARGLVERGWSVAVAYMTKPNLLEAELESNGVTTFDLGISKGRPDPRAAWRLRRAIKEWRPDIVHSHMVHANLLARATRMICRIETLICTAHNVYEHAVIGDRRGRMTDRAYRWTDRLCDLTTIICQKGVERYASEKLVRNGALRLVHNGIDTSAFTPNQYRRPLHRTDLGLGIDDFTWLHVGRFEPQKNHALLLRAFARLLTNTTSRQVLLMVGSGALEPASRELASELKIEANVVFLGSRSDVPDLMNAADAYVMSSDWEGFPIVLLEAAASALPTVTTRVGGNDEIIQHDVSGYLVDQGSLDGLSDAMLRMANQQPAERAAMGTGGRQYVQRAFDIEIILDEWESIYQQDPSN